MDPLGTFLQPEQLEQFKPEFGTFQLVQTETYNEYELAKSIETIDKKICGAIAIQLAIVGYGNKTFGTVIVDNNIIDIQKYFKLKGIKIDTEFGSKLVPKDVTPRRLIRFYRFAIDEYVKSNLNVNTYLFKKYCLNKNEKTRKFIYPGFEHIADPKIDLDKIKDLLDTYSFLDSRLNTKIKDRIVRVLIARGFNEDAIRQIQLPLV